MVITHLSGGLGNQMFQYAAARCLAYKINTELKIDKTACDGSFSDLALYKLDKFNIQENFATAEDIKNLGDNDVLMNALYQKDIFFIDIADIIRQEFTLKNPLGEISSAWEKKILSAECPVTLHVRHGDYDSDIRFRILFGTLPSEYYYNAVEKLKSYVEKFTLFVFSDDLDFVKNNFKFDMPVEFVEGCENDYEEIYLMSLSKHNIVANSSFAWWGAWLNKNPDKKVFAPTPWFRNADIADSRDGIIPDDWIKIPVDFDKKPNFISPPLISIILRIDDNPTALNSFLITANQTVKEFEIILVDTGIGNLGETFRQFVDKVNITFLRAEPKIEKVAAWNMGLSCARGDYVLFFDSKDFILNPATADFFLALFDLYEATKKNYAESFNDFMVHAPNIICSTLQIFENTDGNIAINGIDNRRFFVKVDERFKALKATAEFSISDRDKMILLATNQINNSLGTKFFKRDFLNENKIRFDENLTEESAELKFLVDTFLHSEKITFIPQPFFGSLK